MAEEPSVADVVRPSLAGRVLTLLALTLVVAGGFGMLLWLDARLDVIYESAKTDRRAAADALQTLGHRAFLGLALVLAGISLYLGWLGLRALSRGVFPPPGTWLLRPTERVRGPVARRRAWGLLLLAVLCLLASVWIPLHAISVVDRTVEEMRRPAAGVEYF